jgi:hypothetical protein
MTRLLQLLFALIGYVCTATVITAALGVFYLWHTDRLNDEKMFRMVALLHDVDLQQIATKQKKTTEDVPPEEPSLAIVSHQQQVHNRNFEVKLLALQRGRQDYDYSLQQLKEEKSRYDRMAQEFQEKLKQHDERATQANVAKVVAQLEQVRPATGKELLMRYISENRMDDAILLMSKMSESKLAKILKTFETDEELDKLHEIHQRIVAGGGDTTQLDKALQTAEPAQSGS